MVILPVLGYKEKTLDVPLSLTDPVFEGSANQEFTEGQNK